MKKQVLLLTIVSLIALVTVGCLGLFGGGSKVPDPSPEPKGPGYSYAVYDVMTPRGMARVHQVEVDLTHPDVYVDLLYPGVVARAQTLSTMANEQGAVAAVNGDFFNISNTQSGVVATNAPVGPARASGIDLKAAVPTRQRFGPSLPSGVTVEDVIGVGQDGMARLGRLTLAGDVVTAAGTYNIRGLNQYAIAQGGIGVFDSHWGTVSRRRSICGTDTDRNGPCSDNVYEVTVRDGKVVGVSATPGSGSIPAGTVVLLGREAGATALGQLKVGDFVDVNYSLVSTEAVPFAFAIGAQPIVRDGKLLAGLNTAVAIRSGAGIRDNGRTLILLALDANRVGMTYAELANYLLSIGVEDGVNLDGGGSSTLVFREENDSTVTVKNKTSTQRSIPNGIGVFVRN